MTVQPCGLQTALKMGTYELIDRAQERTLAERFLRSRSERAFRRMYRAQTPRMLRLARRLTARSSVSAEDVVQEAWIRAVRSLDQFEWRSSLAGWLGGFVVNVAREQRRKVRALEDREDADIDWGDPLVRIELSAALEQLAPGFRSVVTLHDVAGFTHEEIATILKIEPGTSKSQLARAHERLRALLRPHEKDKEA